MKVVFQLLFHKSFFLMVTRYNVPHICMKIHYMPKRLLTEFEFTSTSFLLWSEACFDGRVPCSDTFSSTSLFFISFIFVKIV